MKLETPLQAEVGRSKRNTAGTEYKFLSGSNIVESLWRPAKLAIRTNARGGSPEEILSYFHLYVWCRCEQQVSADRFAALGELLERARLECSIAVR